MSVVGVTLSCMVSELPSTLRYLAQRQRGIVSRSQAIRAGLSPDMIKFRIRSNRWQQLHPGVYATFTGIPGRGAWLWAALLAAGPGAVLSYQTAAELHGLSDKPTSPIHVTIPAQRHLVAVSGVCLHRSGRAVEAMEQRSYPPRTRVEETVLDLTQAAKTFDDVCGWVTRAIARELTDETRLNAAMSARRRLRWRADLKRTYRRRGGRGPFGAGVPLPPGRGTGSRAARVGPAGGVHHARRPPGPTRPRVRTIRPGHRARRAARTPAREPGEGQDQGQCRRCGREADPAVRLAAG